MSVAAAPLVNRKPKTEQHGFRGSNKKGGGGGSSAGIRTLR